MNQNTVEIARGIFWVGGNGQEGGLHCNPYLIVENGEGILIDPGSVLDFEMVYKNVSSILPISQIKYVILHHQDPDFCSSVPLFEQRGANFTIVTHWRTMTLVQYYGIHSPFYIVNNHDYQLRLSSGRTLDFIMTPYLHFPGAITTYDSITKTLFSSDLFGAFSYDWTLFAQPDYIDKMKVFHEHYMPSNDILRPVMELFLDMDIAMIAPQHGSIIKHDIATHIKALRELECGAFLNPVRKNLRKSGGYQHIGNLVLKRLASIFGQEEVQFAIRDLDMIIDENMEIVDYNYAGHIFWNMLFEQIATKKGTNWLMVIETFVMSLVKEYDLLVPHVYEAQITHTQARMLDITKENDELREINLRLKQGLKAAEDKLLRHSVTNLYNNTFFRNYIQDDIATTKLNPALIIICLDNLQGIKFNYGDAEVDNVLITFTYILESLKQENELFFKLDGAVFACYLPHTTKELATAFAEQIRNAVVSSQKFIETMSVSIGVVCLNEIQLMEDYETTLDEQMYREATARMRIAQKSGMNTVCNDSFSSKLSLAEGYILLADEDHINTDVVKTFLENTGYDVITASDGEEAYQLCQSHPIRLIISAIMMPKMDGFLLREKLLEHSSTKSIPFMFLSYLKDDNSVTRASALGIKHYFQKPFLLSELIGVTRNILKDDIL